MKNYIIAALVGAVVVLGILFLIKRINDKIPEVEQRYQRTIDSLQEQNKQAAVIIHSSQIKIDSLTIELQGAKQSKEVIYKKIYDEKIIHHYDTATAGDIERFFAERYGEDPEASGY